MQKLICLSALTVTLMGCGAGTSGLFGTQIQPAPQTNAKPSEGTIPEDARTVDDFDTTTAEDRAEALDGATATGAESDLGITIASLGDVTEPGIWLKTPLVSEAAKGRIAAVASGKAVAVDLIPLDAQPGAGSRISLAAMRLLKIELTSLPEIRVYRAN